MFLKFLFFVFKYFKLIVFSLVVKLRLFYELEILFVFYSLCFRNFVVLGKYM